jgi:quercetin dioxygenase-like cupin family protein
MRVKHIQDIDVEAVNDSRGASRQVLVGQDEGPNFAMRRFVIEAGGHMPAHTNTVEHEQYVLSGSAKIGIGEEVYEVAKGNVVFIPAGIPHWYSVEGEEPFVFLCMVPNLPDRIELL